MHIQFLDYLVDPITKDILQLKEITRVGDFIIDGMLISKTSEYPIIGGIPRFVTSDSYSKSFSWEWKKWPRVQFETENIGKPMEGHTRRMWEQIVGFSEHELDLKDKTILDIGCGSGRFIEIARSKGAKVIGLDYSDAVEAAYNNFPNDPDVCIIQADALQSPIKTKSIDGAYTIGVLHHTPSPKLGVNEANRELKSEGWFAICVYGKGGFYNFSTVQLWRKLFKFLWPLFKHYPPLIYTYFTINIFYPISKFSRFLGRGIKVFFPFVTLADKNWALLDTFDCITPSYQSTHESYEVFSWLRDSEFSRMEPTNWGSTSYFSRKK